MRTAKQKEVTGALKKIGFKQKPGGKELKYVYLHEEQTVVATVSVPKGRGNIRTKTLHSIRRQAHLDAQSFEGAVKCPFDLEDYQMFIKAKGLVD